MGESNEDSSEGSVLHVKNVYCSEKVVEYCLQVRSTSFTGVHEDV